MKRSLTLLLLLLTVWQARADIAVYFLDVGQADAAIITADETVILIDGGNPSDSSLIYSYLRNTLDVDTIDLIISTHPDSDHVGGIAGALNACTVERIISPVTEYDTRAFNSMLKYAALQGITLELPEIGTALESGQLCVEILAPVAAYSDTNNSSIVTKVVYGEVSFLFTGDIQAAAERDILASGTDLHADVLKVAHHGSASSSTEAFIQAVAPSIAVISVELDNQYQHPAPAVIDRLEATGATIYRTDLHGTIVVKSDGYSISVETKTQPTMSADPCQ